MVTEFELKFQKENNVLFRHFYDPQKDQYHPGSLIKLGVKYSLLYRRVSTEQDIFRHIKRVRNSHPKYVFLNHYKSKSKTN